jgi:hypothetical protein
MKNKDLISILPYRNIPAAVYSLVLLAMLIGLYIFVFTSFLNGAGIIELQKETFIKTSVIVLWVSIIGAIIWSYKIARRTGREPVLWVFIGWMFGPIGLLILSFKDYYLGDPDLKRIVMETRQEYKSKLKVELRTIYDKALVKQRKIKLTNEYQGILHKRCAKELTAEKIEVLKELVGRGIIDKDIDIEAKARVIAKAEAYNMDGSDQIDWKKEWIEDESRCPACGTEIDEAANHCLNCGLKIK